MIRIPINIVNQLVKWTEEERPNEAAGYLFKDNTIFCRIITKDKSVVHFADINPENLLGFIEKYGKPSAIFHSHPCEAVPSQTDLKYMITTIPVFKCVWFIMSSAFELRAWTISYGSDEFTGRRLSFPMRGETIRPLELEVEIIE